MTENGKKILKVHEGFRGRPYDDKTGKTLAPGQVIQGAVTIGWGRNLNANPLRTAEASLLFDNDVDTAETAALSLVPGLDSLAPARRDALINMAYNLGYGRLAKFEKMLAALKAGDWNTAADEMLDSKWAAQVGDRARHLSYMVRLGEYPPDDGLFRWRDYLS